LIRFAVVGLGSLIHADVHPAKDATVNQSTAVVALGTALLQLALILDTLIDLISMNFNFPRSGDPQANLGTNAAQDSNSDVITNID
jgi:hypothetical protein